MSWTAPDDGGAPITGYRVQHKLSTASWPSNYDSAGASSRSKEISLSPGTYDARVRACNRVDCGPWSESDSGTVVAIPPDPSISISNLVGSMDEGGSDSFTVSASNLVSSNSYTIRVTTSNSDIGFNQACSDRQEDVTVPANRTSYSTSITLHGCDDPGGTVTAKLRRGTTDVDTASQYVTVNPPDPGISISNLVGSMDEGGSDSFTVSASNLVSSNSYTIRVTTSNSDIGFNQACSDRQEDVTVPANRTSYSTSITLHGCDDPGGTVTAKLRRGTTDVDTASQYVTVNPPDPGISISNLVGSMDEGGSDSFTVSASNLVSSNSYTIRVTTSNSDIGFNQACSDRQEDVTVPANRTSYSTSITLHGCDDPGGTVTAKLRRGTTDVDTASQYVTVNPPDPGISISNLVGSMDEGGSDSFTVSASNLVSSNSYTIRVTTSNSDIGFNQACSDRQEDVTVPANRTSYSTSITLHGCDDPGGTVTAKLRRGATDVDTASQYVTVTAPPPPAVTKPSTMSQPRLKPGNSSLGVEWDPPTDDGGSAITQYRVQHKLATELSWPPDYHPVGASSRSTTIGGLTNGSAYHVRVLACNNSGQVRCGNWSGHATSTPENRLAAPTRLDVEPRPKRIARLTWTASHNADSNTVYDVYAEDPTGASSFVASTTNSSRWREIALDNVVHGKGLADADYFKLWVVAKDRSGVALDSDASVAITIVDSAILSIDGDSNLPAGQLGPVVGRAEVKWTQPSNATAYTLRWRKLGDDASGRSHSELDWQLDTSSLPSTFRDEDKREMTNPAQTTSIVEPLDLGEIYAFQLNYMTGTGMVFSARDAYVWPSTRAGGFGSQAGERVATFPLNYPWPNKTYSYVFCADTFENASQHATTTWAAFIDHAFSQWDLATGGLVTTERLDTKDCADYSKFVAEVVTQVKSFVQGHRPPAGIPPTDSEIEAHATELLDKFDQSRIKITRDLDERLNEVFMFDDSSANAVTVDAFEEISNRVGPGWCPYACTFFPTPLLNTVDISLRASRFQISDLNVPGADDTADAGEISFNSCQNVHFRYATLVHEAGHALGITGGKTGVEQDRFHPNKKILDSVMSYGQNPSVSCSPTPLDVMAIYALYQSR